MSDYLVVMAIALLPAAGSVIGGLVAESTRAPRWVIGSALHAAAGVAIALVSVELMPRILEHSPAWVATTAFFCGAWFSVALAKSVEGLRRLIEARASTGAWMVYMAIAADLFSDGLMTGVGATVSTGLGVLLGASQLVANVPGGFASVANFRAENVPRGRRMLVTASFALPIVLGATCGYWLLRDVSTAVQHVALAFVVGILLSATVEDTLPQGDAPEPPRLISTASFAGGFALFTLLAVYAG